MDTTIIVINGLTLLVLPYTLGDIKYPSSCGNIIHITIVAITKGTDTTLAIIIARILVISPPK